MEQTMHQIRDFQNALRLYEVKVLKQVFANLSAYYAVARTREADELALLLHGAANAMRKEVCLTD